MAYNNKPNKDIEGQKATYSHTVFRHKGGGAIGEKLSMTPAAGTSSLNIPVFTSPVRSGFEYQLSILYDSVVGNGPFERISKYKDK
jgi:hypothetical protein